MLRRCAAAAVILLSLAAATTATASSPGRYAQSLSTGWRFRFGGDPAGVTDPAFDDRAWRRVGIPHTWNRLGEYGFDRTAQSDRRRGVGWYRLRFSAPRSAGRREYLQFDGVGNVAEVWLNGIRIGEHKGAFSRFRFDVTAQLKSGASNVLVVAADNSKPAPDGATANVIPLSGDFFVFGGLYRGVSLIGVDDAHIDLLDHGGPGIYAHTIEVGADRARVGARILLRNDGTVRRDLQIDTRILDARGVAVGGAVSREELPAAAAADVAQTIDLAHPRLWNGRRDPYLYAVRVDVREGSRLLDRVTEPLGVRTFRVDAEQGFFLNGRHLALHGVSRHQDRADKGWALSPADHAEDMSLIVELGANALRMAHYEHAQEWQDDADSAGMAVWAEIPFVNQASFQDGEPTPELTANAREQLLELIHQGYNHPSIMMWSVGNEIDLHAALRGEGTPPGSLGLLRELAQLAGREDPSRPTVFADCCEDPSAFGGRAQAPAGTTDLVGYNRYFGWYTGTPDQLGTALDRLHAKHPGLPMSISEYGAGGALSQHTDNPQGGAVSAAGRFHPEEYQSWIHEQSWKAIRSRQYLFASWIWNMFDFAADGREEGDSIDLNDKGLVTYDRRVKKDAFFFYEAQWSDRPVLHLTGRRYVNRAYPVADVRAYSNAPAARLTVNGIAAGTAACPDRVCVWRDVALRAGDNRVTVDAEIRGRRLADTVHWNAPAAHAGVRIDAGELGGRVTAGGERFGSDNFFDGGVAKRLHGGADGPGDSGSGDPALYGAYREGAFTYDIPLPNATWKVTLYLLEPDPAMASTRTFAVRANGGTALESVNPAVLAGGVLRAVERNFDVTVRNGHLRLEFVPQGGPAVLSALAVRP